MFWCQDVGLHELMTSLFAADSRDPISPPHHLHDCGFTKYRGPLRHELRPGSIGPFFLEVARSQHLPLPCQGASASGGTWGDQACTATAGIRGTYRRALSLHLQLATRKCTRSQPCTGDPPKASTFGSPLSPSPPAFRHQSSCQLAVPNRRPEARPLGPHS